MIVEVTLNYNVVEVCDFNVPPVIVAELTSKSDGNVTVKVSEFRIDPY